MNAYIEILEQQLENTYERVGEIENSGIVITTPTKLTEYCRQALRLARELNDKVKYYTLNRVTDWNWDSEVIDMLRGCNVKQVAKKLKALIACANEATTIARIDSSIGHIDWLHASYTDLHTARVTLTKNMIF